MKKLSAPQLKTALRKLPDWTGTSRKITRHFEFANFRKAFAFMTKCAVKINRLDHHPEWSNVYNKVSVSLNTHDSGGVTQKDIKLAAIMDKIAAPLVKKD